MANYDTSKYYWIKLTDRFMTSDTVDFLMSQKEGANYVVLYQMLCLKTVNNGGVMARKIGEVIIPFDIDKIQRDCKWFSMDTIRVALELYKSLGLVYEQSEGILAITNFERLIGSQSIGAAKKEQQIRARSMGGTKVEILPPDIRDKEIRDKDNRNINNNEQSNTTNEGSGKKRKVFVPPTYEQVLEYATQRGRQDLAKDFFDYFSVGDWVDSNGNKVKNWKQKFITWESRNEKKTKPTNGSKNKSRLETSTSDINEFFQRALDRSYNRSYKND